MTAIADTSFLDILKSQFNNKVALREKRLGIYQLIVPLYHEDGDMVDIYIEKLSDGRIRISDFAMTLMRLSYSFELDTPNKERIFQTILAENRILEENGRLFIDTASESLCPAVLQFAQALAKVASMRLYKREVIQSLFYETLDQFVEQELRKYNPRPKILPLPSRDDLEVDYQFDLRIPIFLFAVKDSSKARLATISCLEFNRAKLPFKSVIVHENFDDLGKKDRSRITNAADKQFTSLDDFKSDAVQYFEREAA